MQKVRQPGSLVATKVLKNSALTERFWILLPQILVIKQFGVSEKEKKLVFL